MARPKVQRLIDQPRLWVRLPYRGDSNREWLRDELGRIRPEWVRGTGGRPGHWEIARSHQRTLVDALATKFGAVDVELEFNQHSQCDVRCRDANPNTVYDSVCSCLGTNHGRTEFWKAWRHHPRRQTSAREPAGRSCVVRSPTGCYFNHDRPAAITVAYAGSTQHRQRQA